MTKRIFVVTGGAGFIGSHIAERLLKEGHVVRVVDNLITGKTENLAVLEALNGDLSYHNVSITDREGLRSIFHDAEVVYHEAAIASVQRSVNDPLETHEHTVTGTFNVLEIARQTGVRRVVFAASAAAYGNSPVMPLVESLPPMPLSPYGAGKLMGEYYAQVYDHIYGLETVCLRYFNVFGARQDPMGEYASVLPKFVQRLLGGQAPIIYGTGEQTRDFIAIENVVQANILAADAPDAHGHVINVATGMSISLLQLLERLQEVIGTDIAPQFAEARSGDIQHSSADVTKARELLKFEPIISLQDGLANAVAWYRTQPV
jgi:nucleoside-diphosphate-sugar epimerase